MLDALEDRHGVSSTIVASQLDTEHWHPVIGEETHRRHDLRPLVYNAQGIKLKGSEPLRKPAPAMS